MSNIIKQAEDLHQKYSDELRDWKVGKSSGLSYGDPDEWKFDKIQKACKESFIELTRPSEVYNDDDELLLTEYQYFLDTYTDFDKFHDRYSSLEDGILDAFTSNF